jgi:hypothetical protein
MTAMVTLAGEVPVFGLTAKMFEKGDTVRSKEALVPCRKTRK